MQIDIPIDMGDRPKRRPPARFAAMMAKQEATRKQESEEPQPAVVPSTPSNVLLLISE